MADVDAKLLKVFLEIYACRNISQAAAALGLAQPTISFYLTKLRSHYDDPLFVRVLRGMLPTPLAEDLYAHAQLAVATMEAANGFHVVFDPASSERAFAMATSDISQTVLLPRLMNRLAEVAPGVTLGIDHIGADTRAKLEAGDLDIAVGFMPQLDAGFYQQKMFRQRYVCIVPKTIDEHWDIAAFRQASHVRVIAGGSGHHVIEKLLRDQQIQRRVVLEVPNYLGLIQIVARTGLVAIVPEGLTWAIDPTYGVEMRELPMPIDLPQYDVKQHWHERNHRDPAHRWLRSILIELFLNRGQEDLASRTIRRP